MAKFKVGDKVEHTTKGACIVISTDNEGEFPVVAQFIHGNVISVTVDGRERSTEAPSLRLTGRPFNVGDRVVVGVENGIVCSVKDEGIVTGIRVSMQSKDSLWITPDGRAWPGTPIIAEHDWEEGIETVAEKMESAINNIGEAAKNCGVLGNWPVEDVTVSPEEVRHIAEMQGKALSGQDTEILKWQHNYVRMALKLTGFELDKEAAALITETVKKVLELGGEFSLDTACEVEAIVNEMYEN